MGLLQRFGLDLPAPPVVSIVGAGTRRSLVESGQTVERYLAGYDYGDSATGDIKLTCTVSPMPSRKPNICMNGSLKRCEGSARGTGFRWNL
jgi:hypothetical protein